MKDLHHLLILVAILITGRADAVPDRNRRQGDQVPGGQFGDYGGSSVNLNTEAQLNYDLAEGGEDQSLQARNALSFSGSNEAAESFGAEANAVARYDGVGQFNEGNTLGENHSVPPSAGFSYGNQLMAEAQASISTEVQTENKNHYAELVQATAATDQSKLQAQFGQGFQNGEDIQANFQGNQEAQYSEVPTVLPPIQGIMQNPYGTTPGSQLNYGPSVHSDNLTKIKTLKENSMLVPYSKLLNKAGREPGSLYAGQSNTVPSYPTNAYGGPFLGTIPQPDRGMYTSISHTGPVSTSNQQSLPMSITGYDVTQSSNWIPYQKGNTSNLYTNKNWNPYTKPAEGLVQVDGEIQSDGKTVADTRVRENGKRSPNWIPYQKENPYKSVLQTDVVSSNIYNSNNWSRYTKPAEGETLVEPDGEIQGGGKTYADTVVQENSRQNPNWVPYQKVNPNKSLLQTDVVSPNSYTNNWNSYTKPAEGETLVQPDEDIQGDGKNYSDTVAQENGKQNPNWIRYQKGNPNKSLVQTDFVSSNSYNNNWNPYTKPAEGETLVQPDEDIQGDGKNYSDTVAQENGKPQYQKGIGQINSGNQNKRSTQIDILVQSNSGFQYSGENKATDAETQANIASSYSRGSPHNWGTQYLAAAPQMNEGIMYGGAKNSEGSLYGNSNKYNEGYLNGGGFQANANSNIENGAEFGAVVGGNTVVQAGSVVEARFGQTTHPSRRPLLAFGHPRNRWHQG